MSNNKQSSSIEWLISQLKISTYWNTLIAELEFMDLEIDDIIEQAKAMHKEEIKDAYNQGYRDGEHDASNIPLSIGDISEYNNAERYYNETFGGNDEQ